MVKRRALGSLESAVLSSLWASPEGRSPAQVLAALDTDLAYTTVMTTLTRLWKKGLAERERIGRGYVYRPVISEADLTARRMHAHLDGVSNTEAALSRFVAALNSREERMLRRVLGELEGQ